MRNNRAAQPEPGALAVPHPVESHLRRKLTRWKITPDDTLAVAVSGGGDSTALLAALAAVHPRLLVLHVNHRLRPEADDDAHFVAALAKRLETPCRLLGIEVGAGGNLEARARAGRYLAMRTACAAEKINHLLLGHQRDDRAETLLINLLRGAGGRGLGALRARVRRQTPDGGTLTLCRPLLELSGQSLRDYLRHKNIDWREDATNLDGNLRARIRRDIIPALDKLAGRKTAPLLARSAILLGRDERLLERLARATEHGTEPGTEVDDALLPLAALRALPASLRHRRLRAFFRRVRPGGAGLSLIHLRAADRLIHKGRTGQEIPWPGDFRLRRERGGLRLHKFDRQACPVAPPPPPPLK